MASIGIKELLVQTENGFIRGISKETDYGTSHYYFGGIPYAKPPLGTLRFLAPSQPDSWKGVLDCTETPSQPYALRGQRDIQGSEDCLYVNLTLPCLKPSSKLPVMFWVGGFVYTFMTDYLLDPVLLVDGGVIYVQCYYRLGPFGFLSINDVTAPGNSGLKDVVMALQWVQKNIEAFGGDPNNITIFGSGSAAAMIHLMMLSPMARGLFHKAIVQSACALNSWSFTKNPTVAAMQLAKQLGIETNDKIEAVEQLKTIPAIDIMIAFQELFRKLYNQDSSDVYDAVFKPCIEDEFEGQPSFLTKSPYLIIKSGKFNKVPFIIGCNNIEGSLLQYVKEDFRENFENYNKNIHLLVPKALSVETNKSKNIGLQLLKFYIKGETLREETTNEYFQFLSDYYFLYYVNKTVKLHSQYGHEYPVYYYILNFAGDWTVPQDFKMFNSPGHAGEIPYIFKLKFPNCDGSRDSIRTRERVVKLWTNFSKFGNPTPMDDDPLLQITWDPVESKDRLNYLSIGSELTKGRNPFYNRMSFWDELHDEHTFLRALAHFDALGVVF